MSSVRPHRIDAADSTIRRSVASPLEGDSIERDSTENGTIDELSAGSVEGAPVDHPDDRVRVGQSGVRPNDQPRHTSGARQASTAANFPSRADKKTPTVPPQQNGASQHAVERIDQPHPTAESTCPIDAPERGQFERGQTLNAERGQAPQATLEGGILRRGQALERGQWLQLQASDLIDRLQKWAADLDAREAELNARSAVQDNRERLARMRRQDAAAEMSEQQRGIERLHAEIRSHARRMGLSETCDPAV